MRSTLTVSVVPTIMIGVSIRPLPVTNRLLMKVTQEKLPKSQLGLEIEIPAETTKNVYEKVVQNLARSANIPGFRKGKVPRQILLQRLGPGRIKEAALEDLVQNSLRDALSQETIEALGNYKLVSTFEDLLSQFQPGQPLTFSASVDVPPDINLGDYGNLNVKAEQVKPDPDAVDNFLAERQVQHATLIPVESRPAQMGDVTVVDYKGRLTPEGEEAVDISGGEATDFQLELEEGRFLADIVQGIVGMTPGETKEIPVTFPEDYPREDLANQKAVFTLTLKELKEKELPELDDDFAQDISEEETIAELRDSLAKQFAEKAEQETKTNKENALIEALVAQVEIDLPETLIEREVQTILTQTAIQMESYGMDLQKVFTSDMMPQLRQRSRPDAIARLRQSLALEELAKRESLTVEEEQINAKSQEVRKQLAGQDVDPQRLRDFVKSDLLKEKAIQWLEEHATIELVPEGSLKTEQTEETESVSEVSEDSTAAQPEATADQESEASSSPPDASEQTAASE